MTILDAVLSGFALLIFSLVLVVSLRYIGLVPETKPPKRTYLFENEMGERQNPFVEFNREEPPPTAQPSTQADTHILSSASDHTSSTGGMHPYAQPDTSSTADEIICPNCGFHNPAPYPFCSQCVARLTHKKH